ncbi:DUF4249 domain-containing protein [Fulvivirga ligni]|uniref:DUF4249 domain-containing protein n=1 Tax=Fulvivirga ligni TaxID=2904246 RepID=UPI001F281EC3|nr:DUF4249 domain-containing protein [Fulvivirga ligni]UII20171.1 DUF4249 domain-containing protein [Fulvivirga ligni]
MRVSLFILLSTCSLIIGCLEPYNPPAITNTETSLIIEGSIESGTSIIKLSRSSPLNSDNAISPEVEAEVSIEDETGHAYACTETSPGRYSVSGLDIRTGNQYRLKIITKQKDEYESTFVEAIESPPIDSIYWEQTKDGLDLYLDAHSTSNQENRYKWSFIENWEFHSVYPSFYEYIGDGIVKSRPNDIYTCYQSDSSKSILIGSSNNLESNIISRFHLQHIDNSDWRLQVKYSILVKQYTLTEEAFSFYEILRKNTETTGTFFDPQPSPINGNFICTTDKTKRAIGYVEATVTSSKRIFISNDELENWDIPDNCETTNVPLDSVDYYFGYSHYIPISYELATGSYISSSRACVNCTLRGTTKKPEFWD